MQRRKYTYVTDYAKASLDSLIHLILFSVLIQQNKYIDVIFTA